VQTVTISGKTHIVTEGESLASIAKKYYGPEFGNQRAIIEAIYKANKSVLDSPNKVRIGDKLIIPTLAQEQKKPAVEEKTESKSLMDKFKDVFVSTEKKAETAAKPGESEDKPAADSDSTKTTVKKPQAVAKTNISDDKPAIIVSEKKISDKKPAVVTKTNPVENKPLASVSSKKAADVSAVTEKKNKPEPKVQGVSYTIQSGDNPYKIAEKLLGDGNRYPEILALNRDRIKNPSKLVVGTQIIVPKR
jgi:nucleoid-associated protein YgaU